jgi:hypothetical protein
VKDYAVLKVRPNGSTADLCQLAWQINQQPASSEP